MAEYSVKIIVENTWTNERMSHSLWVSANSLKEAFKKIVDALSHIKE